MVQKHVLLERTVRYVVDVPDDWDADMIEFFKNESSSCADNDIRPMWDARKLWGCLCGNSKARYIRDVTPEEAVSHLTTMSNP